MKFAIDLAGIPVAVAPLYEQTSEKYLPYRTDEKPLFSVSVTPKMLEAERALNAELMPGQAGRLYTDTPEGLDDQAAYRQVAERLPDHGAVLFHGSSLAMDGQGFLFAGHSGAGKSTHARMWREFYGERVTMINDDKPILRCTNEGIFIGGSPWNGKHNLGGRLTVPLRAICFIEKSPENRLLPIDGKEAYSLALRQCYPCQNAARMMKLLGLVEKIVQEVPMYRMECNMEPSAAQVAWEGIMRETDGSGRNGQ